MCVLLGPEVIINNAFLARQPEAGTLTITELKRFCSIVYEKITSNKQAGAKYKYVCLQVDREELEDFFSSDERFIKGIDTVYMTNKVDIPALENVNAMYAPEIRNSLKEARIEFAAN